MDLDPLLLSRIQFAFTISFHIIFPAFTIGLAAWLATIEGMQLATGNPVYRRVFDFWLRVFAVSFGMGVVSGIVMAFQFGTNWSVLSEKMGAIQGPLLGYETFTAFLLEATFLGVVLFGRDRVPPLVLLPCLLHDLARHHGLLVLDHGQQQLDAGAGRPPDRQRQDHSEQLGGDHCRPGLPDPLDAHAAGRVPHHRDVRDGDRCLVRSARCHRAEARVMMHWGMGLAAPLIVVQLFFGHLNGKYVLRASADQVRGHRGALGEPATRHSEVWFAIPDEAKRRNLFAIEFPKVGSFIATGTWDARVPGLADFPEADWPPW